MVVFDLDLQGHLGLKRSKLAKNGLVRAITFEEMKLGSPNLTNRRITDISRIGLYMTKFDLDLQGHLGSKVKIGKNGLVRVVKYEGLKLGSPNLANRCILGRSRRGLYMTEFDLDLQGHLGSK